MGVAKQKTIATNKENNKTDEKAFITERDNALKAGLKGTDHGFFSPASALASPPAALFLRAFPCDLSFSRIRSTAHPSSILFFLSHIFV
eukprot:3722877-Rhodomonas_salina.2